jgi:hypothetical protein
MPNKAVKTGQQKTTKLQNFLKWMKDTGITWDDALISIECNTTGSSGLALGVMARRQARVFFVVFACFCVSAAAAAFASPLVDTAHKRTRTNHHQQLKAGARGRAAVHHPQSRRAVAQNDGHCGGAGARARRPRPGAFVFG